MIDTPSILEIPVQPTAMIYLKVPRDNMEHVMGPAIQEVYQALLAQEIRPRGSWFTHHIKMDPAIFEFEVCVPINERLEPIGRVVPGLRRAATVAQTTYHGGYEGLGDAWEAFMAWIQTNGKVPAPDLWECYVLGPDSSPDPINWQTQLIRPLI